jgi:hypothetical protein
LIQPSSANPQWQFSFCSSPSLSTLTCFTMTPLSLTSSQDISTQIQSQSAFLPPPSGASTPGGNLGYQQSKSPLNGFSGERVIWADQFPSISAAFAACNLAPGCMLMVPPGNFTIPTQITPSFPLTIQGAGAAYQNAGVHCTTTLTWTGGASAPFLITGAAGQGTTLRNFCLNATGTSPPVFVDIDNGVGGTMLDHVMIDMPTVAATVAAFRWGNTGAVVDASCNSTFVRAAGPIGYDLLNIQAKFTGVDCRSLNSSAHEWWLGSASNPVDNFNCVGCSAEADNLNEVAIVANFVDNANFLGLYCEVNGASGTCLTVPNTAVAANGVNLIGGRFSSTLTPVTAPIDLELSTAKVRVEGITMVGTWANPNNLVTAGACASFWSSGNMMPLNNSTFSATGVGGCGLFSLGDVAGGNLGLINSPTISQSAGVGPNIIAVRIGSGTTTTAGTLIASGNSQSQTPITITGALATDVAQCSLNAAPGATWQTGIQMLPPVVTSNTVTVWLSNPTAGNITPAAMVVRCTVTR